MNCKKCGTSIIHGEAFCRSCGTPVSSETTVKLRNLIVPYIILALLIIAQVVGWILPTFTDVIVQGSDLNMSIGLHYVKSYEWMIALPIVSYALLATSLVLLIITMARGKTGKKSFFILPHLASLAAIGSVVTAYFVYADELSLEFSSIGIGAYIMAGTALATIIMGIVTTCLSGSKAVPVVYDVPAVRPAPGVKLCSKCGNDITTAGNFCKKCGTPTGNDVTPTAPAAPATPAAPAAPVAPAAPTTPAAPAIKRCVSCGADITTMGKFCKNCGTPTGNDVTPAAPATPARPATPAAPAIKRCSSCGIDITTMGKFCKNCGTPTGNDTVPATPARPATPAAPAIKRCSSCGIDITTMGKFCKNCGTPTGNDVTPAAPARPVLKSTAIVDESGASSSRGSTRSAPSKPMNEAFHSSDDLD